MTSVKAWRVVYFIAYPQRMAGANRSLFELITNLPEQVQPIVFIVDEGPVAEAYRQAGVEVHIVRPGRSLGLFGKAALAWSTLKKARVAATELAPFTRELVERLRSVRPALIHANGPRSVLLVGAAARLTGLPMVAHLRGQKPLGGIYWSAFGALPNKIITVCDAIHEDLPRAQRAKAVTVYNGTADISSQGKAIPWLQSLRQQGVLVIACFASVTPFKGQHHLLRAAAILNRRGWKDNVVYLFVGDIPAAQAGYYQRLVREADNSNVDNVTFAGWQSDPFSFYRHCDLSVLPSLREGLPRTHLEAMCFGIPIVSTDVGGVREQLDHGRTGFIVPAAEPPALANSIERLLDSPALRTKLGEAGKEHVAQKFSTGRYVEGVVRVYSEVLKAPCDDFVAPPTQPDIAAAPYSASR